MTDNGGKWFHSGFKPRPDIPKIKFDDYITSNFVIMCSEYFSQYNSSVVLSQPQN